MGRLDHLKESLPAMLGQPNAEVIVVDYSCPQNTAKYVAKHFPSAKVVKVEGKTTFSNWAARNLGAAEATGDLLIFCDADTILKPDALAWIDEHMGPRTYGHFDRMGTTRFNRARLRLGFNQLRGFHAIEHDAFRRFDGYDDILEGYAAGADTDLEVRLSQQGYKALILDPEIVENVIEHDNDDRFRNHDVKIKTSYAAGYLYRKAKQNLLRMNRRPNLPLPVRQTLYAAAKKAAAELEHGKSVIRLNVEMNKEDVGMPLQLGFKRAKVLVSLSLQLVGEEPVATIPTLIEEEPTVAE
jgi:glycosyltransferase involved in cell wall biosynthesis